MTYLNKTLLFSIFTISSLLLSVHAIAQQVTRVGVDQVRVEVLKQTLPVIGRLITTRGGVIAARISGPIAEMKVKVGDHVEEGDVIALLLDNSLKWRHQLAKAETNQAKAAISRAKSLYDLRLQELKRLKQLKKSAAFSQARLEDKSLEVARARSALAESQASLNRSLANQKLTGINLFNAKITAPFPGVVTKRYADVGAYVTLGSPIINLIDNQSLEIEAKVPARSVSGLIPGTKISFKLETKSDQSQRTFSANVRAVVPDENPLTRTRTVRFTTNLSSEGSSLVANQSVVLEIPVGVLDNVVTIHKDAVINRKGKNVVFLVKDGTASIRTIKLGESIDTRFVVLSGVQPGDLAVVRGNERLRPEQKVKH